MKRGIGVALILVLAACGGGGGSKAASGGSSDATLKIRDQATQLKAKSGADFAAANDGQGLAIGDTLRTNGTGFAQINYHDGSLTRLDANAQFTLTDLAVAQQSQRVVGHLDGGRAWNNVQKISSSEGRYEIDTDVATASVRGTQFNVDCTATDGSCTFSVVDGTVTVTPAGGQPVDLHAGESLTVKADHTTTKGVTDVQDEWLARNITIDIAETNHGSSSNSSSSSSSSGSASRTDPCALSAGEVAGVLGVPVGDGQPDGREICRYLETATGDGLVDVVVKAAPSGGLASEKAQEPVPVEDIAGLGDEAYLADYFPSAALSVVRGTTEFYIQVSSPRDDNSDTGFVYDAAALKAQAIALMQNLLAK